MAPRRARSTPADPQQSFDELYRGHRAEVYRDALRKLGNVHDAEDLTQAAFVDAYRAVLRGTRPEAPRAWLLAIAENVRRRRFRTSLRRPREEPLAAEPATAPDESHEQAQSLLDALATLTADQREAFLLREIAGLSYDEIAERTGSTVASVQMLLFRARHALRDELEPPQVHGVLVPLATVAARFQGFGAAPRAAGAVGAAVLTLGVGASMPQQAESMPRQPPVRPAGETARVPVVSAEPTQPRPVVAAKPHAAVTAHHAAAAPAPAVARTTPPVRGAQPPAEPRQHPAAETVPQSRSGSEPTLPPLRVEPPAPPATSIPVPPIPVPSVAVPPLPEQDAEPLPDPVLESVAGAAGAAGAGAPPLPVLPPDPVPPVP